MILQSKNVYFEEKLQPLQIHIEGTEIVNILPYGMNENVVDYGENIILPGLIDVHSHGYNSVSCNTATKEWLKEWTSYLPSEGVTSVLFAYGCGEFNAMYNGLRAYAEFEEEGHTGTQIVGAYSEGPFVGSMPGAQDLGCGRDPTIENIDKMNEACKGRLRYVMVAPEEMNGDYEAIRYCREKGMAVSIGHSGTTFETCAKAIAAGANSFTHTYNGMSGLHHREPGVAGAAMFHDNCYAELICDGVHVNKIAANILARVKGKDRLLLITDSATVKGLKPGVYQDGDSTVIVDEKGRVTKPNGTIAGSSNKLNKVLEYAIKEAKIDPVTAYNACTKNPCEMLGIRNKGKIQRGYDADLAVFDENYNPVAVYILGEEFK